MEDNIIIEEIQFTKELYQKKMLISIFYVRSFNIKEIL